MPVDGGRGENSTRAILRRFDVALLRACEFFFGPRESWAWWQRATERGYLIKRGWL